VSGKVVGGLMALACAVVLAAPGSAHAYVTGSLAVTSVTTTGPYSSTVSFDARVEHACPEPGPYGPPYCGFFPLVTTVPAGSACTNATPRWVGPISEAIGPATYTQSFSEYQTGTWTACLYAHEDGIYVLLASASYQVPGGPSGAPITYPGRPKPPVTPPPPVNPAPPTTPAPPAETEPDFSAGLRTDLIPSRLGRSRRYVEFAISTRGVPTDVHPERFDAIVSSASERWGLAAVDTTRRSVRNADGRNQVGFSWSLPGRTLGVQTDTFRVRRARFCIRRSGSGRCVRAKARVVSRRLIDRDLAINAVVPWQQGPTYPGPSEYDLESVVIHELGHMAGNRHARACRNSPMIPALDTGEWWRGLDDYDFGHCARVTAQASATPRPFEHAKHVTRTVEEPLAPGPRALQRDWESARSRIG
jgi:hypothetical protein